MIDRRDIAVVPVDEVSAGPEQAALRARKRVEAGCDRLLVHFDVDVIDFTDVPSPENTGRNEGLAYDDAMSALRALLASPRLAGVTITELNPDHAEQDAQSIERFAAAIAASALQARRRSRTASSSRLRTIAGRTTAGLYIPMAWEEVSLSRDFVAAALSRHHRDITSAGLYSRFRPLGSRRNREASVRRGRKPPAQRSDAHECVRPT